MCLGSSKVPVFSLIHLGWVWLTLAHFGLVGLTLDQFDSLWISLTHFGLVWLTLVLQVGLTLDQFLDHFGSIWITLVQFDSYWAQFVLQQTPCSLLKTSLMLENILAHFCLYGKSLIRIIWLKSFGSLWIINLRFLKFFTNLTNQSKNPVTMETNSCRTRQIVRFLINESSLLLG